MTGKTFTLKRNAVRAARKLLADDKAPAPSFAVKTAAGGGFRIVWDTPAPVQPPAAAAPAKSRDGTKQQRGIAMLKRPGGASDAEIKKTTGWKIVRGFIAGTVKKKLGHTVISSKEAERGRVYRVVA